jgi:transcription termination factor Rho
MYDILQLNDMLVPELQDIAEQLAIPNFKKIDKQELVDKILDNQSVMKAETKSGEEKPKRKRTLKSTLINTPTNITEDTATQTEKAKTEPKPDHKPAKRIDHPSDKKRHIKKSRAEEDDEEDLQRSPVNKVQYLLPSRLFYRRGCTTAATGVDAE